MALLGYTFDRGIVSARNDASLFAYLNRDYARVIPKRGNLLAVTTQGLNLIIDTGQAFVMGRHIELTEATSIIVNNNSSGYLVIEIDLNQTNTSTGTPGTSDYTTINNQISLKTVSSLRQDDIHNGGKIYQFNLGQYTATSNVVNFTKNTVVYNTSSIAIADITGLEARLQAIESQL